MYRVAGNMMESYYGDEVQQRKSNLDMPHVTVNNRRMTNVQMSNGDTIQGIRRNKDLGYQEEQLGFEAPKPVRPLRYTPGLKCDAALEALRPERDMKHQALQGGEWKRKLIQHPTSYDGSFADADMQRFRPTPNPNPMDDQWFVSRLPDQQFMDVPQQPYVDMASPTYPQDELARIKMRNRRFQQSCAMEGMQMQQPMQPMWRGPVLQPPAAPGPYMTEDMMMGGGFADELANIEQDLNMTRRATRPFVPTSDPSYNDLQRQINLLETTPFTPVRPARFNADDLCSTDQLAAPRRFQKKEEAPPAAPAKPVRNDVGIADQIAIRSYVLGKSIGKVGSD